jgi:hypothetical protein
MFVCIMHQCCGVDTSYGSWLGLTIPAYRWDVTTGAQQDEVATRLATEKASIAILEHKKAYDVTLARLAEAEEEARVAASAHDAALARADQERAAAKAATVALAPPHDDGASSVPVPVDLHGAMLLQEAAALLNHHAQAVAINNIRSLVPIVLDIDSGTFNRWRDQFLLTLGKFSLQDHVHLDAPVSSLDWDQMDCVVKSWILSSLTDYLTEITSSQGGTAWDSWLTVSPSSLRTGRNAPSSLRRGSASSSRATAPLSSTATTSRRWLMTSALSGKLSQTAPSSST